MIIDVSGISSDALVHLDVERVLTVIEITKEFRQIRMLDRFARIVSDQILLGHIGHVIALVVLGQKMVERLFFLRSAVFWNGLIPFLGIGKHCIHIKNHAAERVFSVPYNLAQCVFRTSLKHNNSPLWPT